MDWVLFHTLFEPAWPRAPKTEVHVFSLTADGVAKDGGEALATDFAATKYLAQKFTSFLAELWVHMTGGLARDPGAFPSGQCF